MTSDFSNTVSVVVSGLGILTFLTVLCMLEMTKAWRLKCRSTGDILYLMLDSSANVVTDSALPSWPLPSPIVTWRFPNTPLPIPSGLYNKQSWLNALPQLVFGRKLLWFTGSCHLTWWQIFHWWQIFQWHGIFATHKIICYLLSHRY